MRIQFDDLELLFDKPVLRGFQFSFDLVPRSKKEALEVVRIIRFFKQGMAPIRSQSNLFLLCLLRRNRYCNFELNVMKKYCLRFFVFKIETTLSKNLKILLISKLKV